MLRYLAEFKSLGIIYGIAAILAVVEITKIHGDESPVHDTVTRNPEATARIGHLYRALYPDRASGYQMEAFVEFRRNNYRKAKRLYEKAKANDRSEGILHKYAETLILANAPQKEIDEAINAWRWNYPHSSLAEPGTGFVIDSHNYKRGYAALANGDVPTAIRFFEADLNKGIRSEQLLYNYAVALLLARADDSAVDAVISEWRKSYSHSRMPDPRERFRQLQNQPPN